MRALDWCALLVGLYEALATLLSQYRANSIATSEFIALSVFLYFVGRLTIRNRAQMVCLSGVYGLGGAGLSIFALLKFADNSKHFKDVGLTNLLAFRSRLISPPSPWILGEWFTILLLTLPFACALSVYLWRSKRNWPATVALIPMLLIVSALMMSLSRAVFFSTGLFFIAAFSLMCMFRLIPFKKSGLLLGAALGALFLILALETVCYPGILEAYSGQHTSQVRSSQGRLAIWNRSLEVFRAYPLWGVGSGNAALALSSTADQEETSGFASRTFSLPVQVLVEKGIVGFLIYCSFLILLAREYIRTMRYSPPAAVVSPTGGSRNSDRDQALLTELSAQKAMACCFAAGIIAVFFRELTYSSLFEHQLTLALVASLSALLCPQDLGK